MDFVDPWDRDDEPVRVRLGTSDALGGSASGSSVWRVTDPPRCRSWTGSCLGFSRRLRRCL